MSEGVAGEIMCRTCYRIWFGKGLRMLHQHHCVLCTVVDRKQECDHCRDIYEAANPPF